MSKKKSRKHQPIPLLALLLAWIVPGTGHMYLGRVKRGIILLVTIAATFWAGIAVGGVMTVDSKQQRWWFVAQMFTGVHGLVSWQRQEAVQKDIEEYLKEVPPPAGANQNVEAWRQAHVDLWLQEGSSQNRPKGRLALVGASGTSARAYTGVAGLLNLMCIFDAAILALMGVNGEPTATDDKKEKADKT